MEGDVAALLVTALLITALAAYLVSRNVGRMSTGRRPIAGTAPHVFDPGSERRAEQRARNLLRSCVDEREWAMYRDLGFIRVAGRGLPDMRREDGHPPYAYLVYPHKPLIACEPHSGRLLAEYDVRLVEDDDAIAARLPASDDVLAKWMALTSDESRLIGRANMHAVGRRHDPAHVRRDLWRLREWERRNAAAHGTRTRTA
jgi:hypothetical protein